MVSVMGREESWVHDLDDLPRRSPDPWWSMLVCVGVEEPPSLTIFIASTWPPLKRFWFAPLSPFPLVLVVSVFSSVPKFCC
jgi:hypothetical protein